MNIGSGGRRSLLTGKNDTSSKALKEICRNLPYGKPSKEQVKSLDRTTIRLDISVMDQAGGEDGWLSTKFFFCVFMGRGGVIETEQARTKRICYMRSPLYAIKNKFFLRYTVHDPLTELCNITRFVTLPLSDMGF